ncbi:hypothetical protein F2P56_004700 [Juglans regia]|uniref:Uncharacterized protein n=1 Tax=Juglans regia TaxID=51240 RepID=A0A834D699_JUGRE|nr:hypothetical protein F2P56_004700 [Juglans regia]
MASAQSYKPANKTHQQHPSLRQKVAQLIGLAPKPSHHRQTGHSDHQRIIYANGLDQTDRYISGWTDYGKIEKKIEGKKSEHKKDESPKKNSKGHDGKSGTSSDSSSDSD